VSPRLPTNASTCRQTSGSSSHFFSVWIASSRIAIRVSDNGRFAMMESSARWRCVQAEAGRFVWPSVASGIFENDLLIDNNGREAVNCTQTDSNQAEEIAPIGSFALPNPRITESM
jgi:hypothetical protein